MPDLSDAQFLEYVLAHSKTERHAFHARDIDRLLELAGVEEVTVDNPGLGHGFLGIDEAEAKRLVTLARTRRRSKNDDMDKFLRRAAKDFKRMEEINNGRLLGKYKVLLTEHTRYHAKDCTCAWCRERRDLLSPEAEARLDRKRGKDVPTMQAKVYDEAELQSWSYPRLWYLAERYEIPKPKELQLDALIARILRRQEETGGKIKCSL